ncbi:hypothetical protein ACFWV1_14760 [Streptomyces sp. NPDC058700]|uniref:hypothetical protein n=1 Tax=unclassified Streptomyces TaxID=2593676 RepID=UPI00365BD298
MIKYVGSHGYLTAFIDRDTDDWKRPGVDAIVKAAMPRKPGAGELILLHDAGGDRTETIAAPEQNIEKLQGEGYRFATVSEALGATDATLPVYGYQLWAGRCFIWASQATVLTVPVLVALPAVVGFLNFGRFALMLVLAPVRCLRWERGLHELDQAEREDGGRTP